MGNRLYAVSLMAIVIGILFSSLLLISPSSASAAIFWPGFPFANNSGNGQTNNTSAMLVQRLCDRQEILGSRLGRLLIDPSLCEQTPPPPAGPTLTLTATPTTITQGATSTLAWNSANATSCTASNGWTGSKALSGTLAVTPSATTTYALSCAGAGGTVSTSVTVGVNTTPTPIPTLTFTANPLNVLTNGTTTLTWSSQNTSLCVASNGWTGNKATSGSLDVAVAATSTYALSCGGVNGTTTQSVTVNVAQHPLPIVTLTANPINVTPGAGTATSTLTWTSTNATTCTAFNGWSGSQALSGSLIVQPNATTTYQLDCTGPGGVGSDDAVVNFVPTPTPFPGITFSASPTNVTPGPNSATSTLTWSTTNANVCIASNGWSGTKVLAGTTIVQPLATTTYQLDCGNVTGTTTASVIVNFVPTPAVTVNHLLISEVYYDVDAAHGVVGNVEDAEWVELFNPTASVVDLSFWTVIDANGSSDMLPGGTSIAAGGYLIIVGTSTTPGFWTIPGGVPVINLGGAIGNGLANTPTPTTGGDALSLRNAATTTIDALSWGANAIVFASPVPGVVEGHSLARSILTADTDLAGDWIDRTTATPGL